MRALGEVVFPISFIVGGLISTISAILWRRYKLFHVVPILYGIVTYIALLRFGTPHVMRWYEPVIPGLIFYAVGWLMLLAIKHRA
jgi:hypothetical protein